MTAVKLDRVDLPPPPRGPGGRAPAPGRRRSPRWRSRARTGTTPPASRSGCPGGAAGRPRPSSVPISSSLVSTARREGGQAAASAAATRAGAGPRPAAASSPCRCPARRARRPRPSPGRSPRAPANRHTASSTAWTAGPGRRQEVEQRDHGGAGQQAAAHQQPAAGVDEHQAGRPEQRAGPVRRPPAPGPPRRRRRAAGARRRTPGSGRRPSTSTATTIRPRRPSHGQATAASAVRVAACPETKPRPSASAPRITTSASSPSGRPRGQMPFTTLASRYVAVPATSSSTGQPPPAAARRRRQRTPGRRARCPAASPARRPRTAAPWCR